MVHGLRSSQAGDTSGASPESVRLPVSTLPAYSKRTIESLARRTAAGEIGPK